MRVAIGSDHAGFELKEALKPYLRELKYDAMDVGTYDTAPVDYPDYAEAVGSAVRRKQAERGIMICGSGVGASVAANKVPGIRAVTAHDSYSVERSVLSNNAQVLTMGQRVIGLELAKKLVGEWLGHRFDDTSASAAKVNAIHSYEGAPEGLETT